MVIMEVEIKDRINMMVSDKKSVGIMNGWVQCDDSYSYWRIIGLVVGSWMWYSFEDIKSEIK
jgi:hypothetical protein